MNSRHFVLLLPFLFLLIAGLGFSYTCYQESAKVSNQGSYYGNPDGNCTLFFNGTYLANDSWSPSNTTLYDGNWTSGAWSGTYPRGRLSVNYTLPLNISYYGNEWRVKYHDSTTTMLAIDFTCMDLALSNGVLQLYADNYNGNVLTWGCIGTGGDVLLLDGLTLPPYVHNEEAMIWNITGTSAYPIVTDVKIPSYPNYNTQLKCWANLTGNITGNATWTFYRKQSGEGAFSYLTSGTYINVPYNTLFNIANLSSGYVTNNSEFYCSVDTLAMGGNTISSNTAKAFDRATFYVYLNTSTSYGGTTSSNEFATLTDNELMMIGAYGYAECNYQSPTSIQYYPPNATGNATYCHRLTFGGSDELPVSQIMNENGNWTLGSCALYVSQYDTCPAWDISNHHQLNNLGSWIVGSSPYVSAIYVTPSSPVGTDDLHCYATLIDVDNATFTAYTDWILNGGIWGSTSSLSVSNNTLTLVSTLPASQTEVGDNISCRVRGYDGSNYGSYGYSSAVNVRGYTLNGISSYPEPTLFGSTKYVNFTTGRTTYTTRVEFTRPDSTTGEYYYSDTSGTSHSIQLPSDAMSPYFNQSGLYYFTLKACACSQGDFDTMGCSEDMCAVPSDYPAKSRSMRYSLSDNMYLYDTAILNSNLTFGTTQQIFSKFSKPVNIFKAVITYPDTTEHTFREILNNETTSSIFILSGQNKDLNETGTYSVDLYAGNGWYSNESDCLATAECSYYNSTLGLTFDVSYGTGGYIENLTLTPTPPIYTNDLNITFNTTSETDATCVTFHRPITYIPQKKRIVSANTTGWVIPVTTGDGKYLNVDNLYDSQGNAVGWSYDIKSCKNNATATCQKSDCVIADTHDCAYCIESTNNSILFAEAGISNVTYKHQIAHGESQVINFKVTPSTQIIEIHFPSLILGEDAVNHNQSSSIEASNWSVTIPFSEIQQAICTNNLSTCVYGNIPFSIRAYVNGQGLIQTGGYMFDVNTSILFEQGMGGSDGTALGQMMGRGFGISGVGGDMILAIAISMIFSIIVGALLQNNIILPVAVFVSFMCGFALIGMLPIWIPILLIIICGALVTKVIAGGIGGGD